MDQSLFNDMLQSSEFFNFNKLKDTKLVKLNLGCGPNFFAHDGWINYDHVNHLAYMEAARQMQVTPNLPKPQVDFINYLKNGGKVEFRIHDLIQPFIMHADNSVDLLYVGQAIEHLNPLYGAPLFIKECFRMLKTGGVLRMTTPDFELLLKAYLNKEMDKFTHEQPEFYRNADPASQLAFLMYGANGPDCTAKNYEGHFFLYTQTSMNKLLSDAGFTNKPVYYYEAGKSLNETMAKETVDYGLSHSFIVEVQK